MPVTSRRRHITPIHGSLYDAVPAGSAYTAQGVRFNGSTGLTVSALTGMADGQKGMISFWFKFAGGDGSFQSLFETRDQVSVVCYRDNTGHWTFTLTTPAAANALNWVSTLTFTSSMTQWAHALLSWDLGGAGRAQAYINDVVSASVPTFSGGSTINYLPADTTFDFGARTGGVIPLNCDIADFYFNTVDSLDLAVTANRRKFISAGLAPVDLGADGSTPTSTAPIIFFHGPLASWHTNDGSGGGFSIASGSLSASATNPP